MDNHIAFGAMIAGFWGSGFFLSQILNNTGWDISTVIFVSMSAIALFSMMVVTEN